MLPELPLRGLHMSDLLDQMHASVALGTTPAANAMRSRINERLTVHQMIAAGLGHEDICAILRSERLTFSPYDIKRMVLRG